MAFSKWIRSSGAKSAKNSETTLSDIIRGMQFCVNSGIEIAEQHYKTTLTKYFDEKGKPVTQTIMLDDEHVINVPVVCMTHHNYMALDELTVKLGIVINEIDIKKAATDYKGTDNTFVVSRASFDVCLANPNTDKKGNTYMDVEMKFKSAAPPESVSKMIDKLNNLIAVSINEDKI